MLHKSRRILRQIHYPTEQSWLKLRYSRKKRCHQSPYWTPDYRVTEAYPVVEKYFYNKVMNRDDPTYIDDANYFLTGVKTNFQEKVFKEFNIQHGLIHRNFTVESKELVNNFLKTNLPPKFSHFFNYCQFGSRVEGMNLIDEGGVYVNGVQIKHDIVLREKDRIEMNGVEVNDLFYNYNFIFFRLNADIDVNTNSMTRSFHQILDRLPPGVKKVPLQLTRRAASHRLSGIRDDLQILGLTLVTNRKDLLDLVEERSKYRFLILLPLGHKINGCGEGFREALSSKILQVAIEDMRKTMEIDDIHRIYESIAKENQILRSELLADRLSPLFYEDAKNEFLATLGPELAASEKDMEVANLETMKDLIMSPDDPAQRAVTVDTTCDPMLFMKALLRLLGDTNFQSVYLTQINGLRMFGLARGKYASQLSLENLENLTNTTCEMKPLTPYEAYYYRGLF